MPAGLGTGIENRTENRSRNPYFEVLELEPQGTASNFLVLEPEPQGTASNFSILEPERTASNFSVLEPKRTASNYSILEPEGIASNFFNGSQPSPPTSRGKEEKRNGPNGIESIF